MKILFIANARMPTEKAHGLQITKTIEAFQLASEKVVLLLPRRRNYIKECVKSYYGLKFDINIKYINNYFGWLEDIWHKGYFYLQRIIFGILSFLYVLKSSADVVYSREVTICFFLSLIGKKVVFEDHEPKKRLRWLYKFMVKRIKKKVVVARNLIDIYNSFGVNKSSYIEAPNGVDLKEFDKVQRDKNIWQKEFGVKLNDKIVLYVGHFYKWKGVYTLLEAGKLIKGKVILIGGIKQDEDRMKEYIDEHQLRNVYIHKFVPHQEIIKYIKSADVLVLPNTAQEERSAQYTTPIKLFEYMASGVPMVASNLKSFYVYLQNGNNALLFEPDNFKDLAAKVNRILSNKELADRLSGESGQQVKKYTWEKRVKRILEFIT